jgi:hypothetical protein
MPRTRARVTLSVVHANGTELPPSPPADEAFPAAVRGIPQAALALWVLAMGSEPNRFHGRGRDACFWLALVAIAAVIAALPLLVDALRDPAHGPARSRPPISRRATLLAMAVAVVATSAITAVGMITRSGIVVGCGVALAPFQLAACRLALRWIGALSRSLAAGAHHRGARPYRVVRVDRDADQLALADDDGTTIIASWPHDPRLRLEPGTAVRARIAPRGSALPYRDAPAAILSIETAAHRRLRLRDRAGIALGLFRALLWAALPFAFFLGREMLRAYELAI